MTSTELERALAYWNVNIPAEEWTTECPEYLATVDHWDRAQLGIKDSDYELMTWNEVKELITTNHLEKFKRVPSHLHRYRKHIAWLKEHYGSVLNYIQKERVRWNNLKPKGGPFEEPGDIKILLNDWPYGIDPDIVHLVVWTKFDIPTDPVTGDLTPESRQQIEDYVDATFRSSKHPENVMWFKNWAALKSVHALEHFHVMLYQPDPEFVKNVTNHDVSTAAQLGITV